ncbi:hypothetical protein [Rathayibacter toxicus]|uniref:hypothetical protein n=1 Tax=Rathayibacter toxicus TaxID=145458 RepID=UPI0011B0DBE0|nr:hypothetical protein [Rathayibacter toxicus]QOD10408.1 hypothetical protein BSG36_11015 [Rathayibacter toxicus]QWL29078.1 hypothetical protein E2R33_11010 [Rathayibacter toxicus]
MIHDPQELGGIAHLCEHLFVRYVLDLHASASEVFSLRSAHTYFWTTEFMLSCTEEMVNLIFDDFEHGDWAAVTSVKRIERELQVIRRELSESLGRGFSEQLWRHMPPLMYDDWAHNHDGFGATLVSNEVTARAVTRFFTERYRLQNADVRVYSSFSSNSVRKTTVVPLAQIGLLTKSAVGASARLTTGRRAEKFCQGLDFDVIAWHLADHFTRSPLVSTEYLASVMSRRIASKWREYMRYGYTSVTIEPGFFGPLLPGMPPCLLVIAHSLNRRRIASLDKLILLSTEIFSEPITVTEIEMSRIELKSHALTNGGALSAVNRFEVFGETLILQNALHKEQVLTLMDDSILLLNGTSSEPAAVLRVYSER